MAPSGIASALGGIARLECEVDPLLQDRRLVQPLDWGFLGPLREWSQAVWQAADALGPSSLSSFEVERGLALAQRPIFVCGLHRSGTTLLRDMLDGHPQLAVVPVESAFFTGCGRALAASRPDGHERFLAREWLQRLANPINQPPYWLLGRSTPTHSPYVDFVRHFRSWSALPFTRTEARVPSWPLAAFALAYARQIGDGDIPRRVARWVEKTPTSELFLDRIWHEYPRAKVLHIVRCPEAVFASYKALLRPAGLSRVGALRHIVTMARCYRTAAEQSRRAQPERYRLVRYEDLVAYPDETMAEVAAFLEIVPSPSLREATVAGQPATNNSAFVGGSSRPHDGLSAPDRDLLAVTVSAPAVLLGYEPIEPSSRLARAIGYAQSIVTSGT